MKPHRVRPDGVWENQKISYLKESFKILPALNLGVLQAAILISLPVDGLRPLRAARLATLNVPQPVNCKESPFFKVLIVTSWLAATTLLTIALETSARLATASIYFPFFNNKVIEGW